MDGQRFDRVTRGITAATSRRQVVAMIAAVALTGLRPRQLAAQASCAPGQADCGGVCVDTCCNNEHCGACGNLCPSGTTCFEGICGCPSGLCCAEGETICNGVCVATCCDNANCGACGNVCTGGLTCFEGQCDCPSGNCPPTKLPDTGSGSTITGSAQGVWTAVAMAAAASALAIKSRLDRSPSPGSTAGCPPGGGVGG